MSIDIVPLAEPYFEPVRQVLDLVAREKRFLAFTEAPRGEEAYAFYRNIVEKGHVFSVTLSQGVSWDGVTYCQRTAKPDSMSARLASGSHLKCATKALATSSLSPQLERPWQRA